MKLNQIFTKLKFIFLPAAIVSLLLIVPSSLLAQEADQASDSAENPQAPVQTVKENLKERLEKIVKEQAGEETKKSKKAWVGKLESIANNTLTIDTADGPKLASVSGETTYVRYPSRAEIKLSDLEIDSYTIAMGYVNGNQVLEAIRIVIENEAPKKPTKTSEYVSLGSFNAKTKTLTVLTRDNQEMVLQVDSDSEITSQVPEEGDWEFSDLEADRLAIIIFDTSTDKEETTYTLTRLHLLPSPQLQEELGPEINYQEEPEESTPSSPTL